MTTTNQAFKQISQRRAIGDIAGAVMHHKRRLDDVDNSLHEIEEQIEEGHRRTEALARDTTLLFCRVPMGVTFWARLRWLFTGK